MSHRGSQREPSEGLPRITVVHMLQALGGVERAVENIIRHVDERRFAFQVLLPPGRHMFNTPLGHRIPLHIAPYVREINPVKDLISTGWTIKMLLRLRPQVVHAHSSKAGFLGRLAAHLMGIPVIYTPHAFSFISHPSPVVTRTYKLLEWMAKHWTTLLLACSESEARIARETLHYRPEKVAVWSNALDPALFQVDDCRPYSFPYICTMSRPSHQKNLTMLVKVVRVLRDRGLDMKCVIIGVGFYSPLEKRIRTLIHRYRLDDQILMTDWMDHETSIRILKHCLCYVSTSRYEGLPLSILEAMALERPVVATDVVGNCDCILPGETGELVPLGDIEGMADRLRRLIGDAPGRLRMGQKARQLFLDKFNVTKTIGKLEHIYESLAEGRRP